MAARDAVAGGTSAQEKEENAQSLSGCRSGAASTALKELGGGEPGTGRSEKSAKRVSKRLRGCVCFRVERCE